MSNLFSIYSRSKQSVKLHFVAVYIRYAAFDSPQGCSSTRKCTAAVQTDTFCRSATLEMMPPTQVSGLQTSFTLCLLRLVRNSLASSSDISFYGHLVEGRQFASFSRCEGCRADTLSAGYVCGNFSGTKYLTSATE